MQQPPRNTLEVEDNPTHATNVAWIESAGALPSPEGMARLSRLLEARPRTRFAILNTEAMKCICSMRVYGSREPMRNALQELLTHTMPPEKIWLVNWILGRWPRGQILAEIPLSIGFNKIQIGIVAPLMPTRIAVSQGPLPFDATTVNHFKKFHAETAQPGLEGCRLTLEGGDVTALSGRWKLQQDRISNLFDHWGLGDVSGMADAVLDGLQEGLRPDSAATIEGT